MAYLIDPSICGWDSAQALMFSGNVPDSLIYYTHIFPAALALVISLFIFVQDRKDTAAQAFFFIALMFVGWSAADLVTWGSEKPEMIMFFWALIGSTEFFIYAGALLLVRSFFNERPRRGLMSVLILLLYVPVMLLSHTTYSLEGFDFTNCDREAIEGPLVTYLYAAEAIIGSLIIYFGLRGIKHAVDAGERRNRIFFFLGIMLFLLSFLFFNIAGTYLEDYHVGQYGLFGMAVFVAFLGYLIVKYRAFNIKLAATHALVYALILLIAAEFIFVRTTINRALVGLTLTLAIAGGLALARSVKREIAQREEIEQLAGRLKSVNRIMSHDVKSVLNKDKMLMEALLDNSFGEVPVAAKSLLSKAEHETGNMLEAVMTILQSGQELVLHKESYDMKKDVIDVIETLTPDARAKGLALHLDLDYGSSVVLTADPLFMRVHVIKNLILNAILYTPSGSITVRLEHKPGNRVCFSVQDTGVGIASEDAPLLFKEGGHGAHSQEVNTHSTGYGLFSAKRIVDAHGGKIWFESQGPGKGTTFFVELPSA
jgi:signal transduction histidine kinase